VIAESTNAPIVGYRSWVADHGRLRSATSDDYWAAGVNEARCGDDEPHRAPELACCCGIHVCDSHATALRYVERRQRWRPWLWGDELVVGAVLLWGAPGRPVIVGELRPDRRGRTGLQYRAPYARILALADGPCAASAGHSLGVPVVRPDYLEAFAREVGGVQLRPPAAAAAAPRPRPALRRRLGPLSLVALRGLGRLAWWLARWSVRIGWWLFCRTVRLAVQVLIAVLGYVLGMPAPRRR
jgi:hypothetical protein